MDITPEQCLEVRAALPLYVGADLDPEEMENVGAHLARCASCDGLHQQTLASRAVLLEGLRTTGARPVPSIWEGIRGELTSEVPALSRRVDSPVLRPQVAAWGLRRTGIGAAAAAAAVVLCFGLAQLARPPLDAAPGLTHSGVVVPSLASSNHGHQPGEGAMPTRAAGGTSTRSGGLVHVGTEGTPLYQNAVEVYVDQGTFPYVAPRPSAELELTGSAPQAMRVRR